MFQEKKLYIQRPIQWTENSSSVSEWEAAGLWKNLIKVSLKYMYV